MTIERISNPYGFAVAVRDSGIHADDLSRAIEQSGLQPAIMVEGIHDVTPEKFKQSHRFTVFVRRSGEGMIVFANRKNPDLSVDDKPATTSDLIIIDESRPLVVISHPESWLFRTKIVMEVFRYKPGQSPQE